MSCGCDIKTLCKIKSSILPYLEHKAREIRGDIVIVNYFSLATF